MLEKFAICEERKIDGAPTDRFKGMMTYFVVLGLLYLIVSKGSIGASIDGEVLTLAGDLLLRLRTLCWPSSI